MYRWLVSYKEEHPGSTLVPRIYDKNPKLLGRWVSTQRSKCKKKRTCETYERQLLRLVHKKKVVNKIRVGMHLDRTAHFGIIFVLFCWWRRRRQKIAQSLILGLTPYYIGK